MSKIYISVHGGVVNGVYSTNKKDQVELYDWDDKDESESSVEYQGEVEEFDNIVKNLHCIF